MQSLVVKKILWRCFGVSVVKIIPSLSSMMDTCNRVGIDPQTKRFFVGTKSVFNKVKIKINYTHADIEKNHGDKPRVDQSYILAWIVYLVSREFIRVILLVGVEKRSTLLIASPTSFSTRLHPKRLCLLLILTTLVTLSRMQRFGFGFPLRCFPPEVYANRQKGKPFGQDKVRFVNTNVTISSRHRRINHFIRLAGVVANLVTFPGRKEGERLKIQVNRCIREQKDISDAGMSKMQTYLYKLIMHIKELLMENMEQMSCVSVTLKRKNVTMKVQSCPTDMVPLS